MENEELKVKEEQAKGLEEYKELKNSSATDVVRALQNARTIEEANTNVEVQEKITQNAKKLIDTTMKVVSNESAEELNKSHFKLHKSASQMYGYNEERPRWQQNMMRVGAAFWFIVYFIVATVTVCPLGVFFDVFKNIFKKGWLSMIVAIIVYLVIVVGIPFLTTFISNNRLIA